MRPSEFVREQMNAAIEDAVARGIFDPDDSTREDLLDVLVTNGLKMLTDIGHV
jgi:hypothetical protein